MSGVGGESGALSGDRVRGKETADPSAALGMTNRRVALSVRIGL